MQKLNLYKLLKGHENETFYSPMVGNVTLLSVEPDNIEVAIDDNYRECFREDGKYHENGECMLFPSKDQRDWNNRSHENPWCENEL